MNVSISPEAGSKLLKKLDADRKTAKSLTIKERKAYWPREAKGYETREEKARRENRQQAKFRREQQKRKETRRRQEELEAVYNMNMISGPEVRARVGFWGGGRGGGSAAIINTTSVFTVELLPLRALRSPSNRILNISPSPPPSSTCI
jgi:hypothetical protein